MACERLRNLPNITQLVNGGTVKCRYLSACSSHIHSIKYSVSLNMDAVCPPLFCYYKIPEGNFQRTETYSHHSEARMCKIKILTDLLSSQGPGCASKWAPNCYPWCGRHQGYECFTFTNRKNEEEKGLSQFPPALFPNGIINPKSLHLLILQ